MIAIAARPKTSVSTNVDCHPYASSRKPPIMGPTIGTSAVPMVT